MSDESVKDQLVCAFLDGELSSQQIDELLEQLECENTRAKACRQAMMGGVLKQRKAVYVDVSAAVREAIRSEPPLVMPLSSRRARVVSMLRKAPGRWRGGAVRRWQVPATGLALAASAALAAVIVIQPDAAQTSAAGDMVAAAAPVASSPSSDLTTTLPVANQMPAVRGSQMPTQLVATATTSHRSATNAPRELVIASPQEPRPIVAQWSHAQTADTTAQQAAAQARVQERLNTYLINHARSGGGYALSGSLGYARVAARPQQTASNE